jgi:hypothetical protein
MSGIARPPCDEAVIRARPCEAPASTNRAWILATAILGSSMAFIDGTVVNVALPVLQSNLRVTLAEVQWVVESYALFLAALLLVGGSLGDIYGRRKIFVLGAVIFTAASVWCGLSRTIGQLPLPDWLRFAILFAPSHQRFTRKLASFRQSLRASLAYRNVDKDTPVWYIFIHRTAGSFLTGKSRCFAVGCRNTRHGMHCSRRGDVESDFQVDVADVRSVGPVRRTVRPDAHRNHNRDRHR